jgi:Zn-finger domain-containing protein
MKKRIYRMPTPLVYGQKYIYFYGFTKMGRPVFDGPFANDEDAERSAIELDSYELFYLKTRDRNRAQREVKAELLKRGGDPDEVLRKCIHPHKDKVDTRISEGGVHESRHSTVPNGLT